PYVTVVGVPRETYASFPWSLSGGGAGELKEKLERTATRKLSDVAVRLGITSVTGEDSLYLLDTTGSHLRLRIDSVRPLVEGDSIRDYGISQNAAAVWPYSAEFAVLKFAALEPGQQRLFWAFKRAIDRRRRFGTPMVQRGLTWWEWQE